MVTTISNSNKQKKKNSKRFPSFEKGNLKEYESNKEEQEKGWEKAKMRRWKAEVGRRFGEREGGGVSAILARHLVLRSKGTAINLHEINRTSLP